MYKFVLTAFSSIAFFSPLEASPEAAVKLCQNFHDICDQMFCRMSPLSAEVIDTFETQFNQLEKEILAAIDKSKPSERQEILKELSELKTRRDTLEARYAGMDQLTEVSTARRALIEALEKELSDLERVVKPEYRRALDEIAIVRDRLKHLRAGLTLRRVLTVPGGSYKMGEKNDIPVTLRPFMVAETHVTQGEWRQLSEGVNPARFKGDYRPVEQVSWASMLMYTVKLNERLGLDEPLDLSQMDASKFSGRWEDGTLRFNGEESKLRVEHKKNGYRLPTDAEFEYLAKNLGESEGEYPHSLSESQLTEYSVYAANSGINTAEVKSKKPLLIDGRPIYDLVGNVWIYTLDAYQATPLGGDNPLQLKGGSDRVIRGGCWRNNAGGLRSAFRISIGPDNGSDFIGLRLVRTLP